MKLRKPRRVRRQNLNSPPALERLEDRRAPGSDLELLGQPLLLPDLLVFGDDPLTPAGRSTGPARPWKGTDDWTADEPARRGVTPSVAMIHNPATASRTQDRWSPGPSAPNGNRDTGWSGAQPPAGLRLGDVIGLERDLWTACSPSVVPDQLPHRNTPRPTAAAWGWVRELTPATWAVWGRPFRPHARTASSARSKAAKPTEPAGVSPQPLHRSPATRLRNLMAPSRPQPTTPPVRRPGEW